MPVTPFAGEVGELGLRVRIQLGSVTDCERLTVVSLVFLSTHVVCLRLARQVQRSLLCVREVL